MIFSLQQGYVMHRFHIDRIPTGRTISLEDGGQVHHLKNVLRLGTGEKIILFDDFRQECVCTIGSYQDRAVTLIVTERRLVTSVETRLTIACALSQKGMDEIVDKLTQLGVDTIIPMQTSRVVVRFEDNRARMRLARWQRLAQSAAEQSQRNTLPDIAPVTVFESVVAGSWSFDLKLIPCLSGERRTISEVMEHTTGKNVLVLIGPEGDFTPAEVNLALAAGFLPVSLGPRVLRVATAAVAVAAYIKLASNKKQVTDLSG